MGNCGASQHAVESWAGDGEWEEEADEPWSEERDRRHHHHHGHGEKHEVQHATEEVTIRITRRQLQELIEKKNQAHGGGLVGWTRRSTEQLLADIMNSGEVHHHHHEEEHWHWKPALQSIPEAAVESS